MVCRWEASERPLSVRTVWVSGIRHAILTREELTRKAGRGERGRSQQPATADPELTQRVCQWLKERAVTPYRGALWESPRPHRLDVHTRRLALGPKAPGPGPICFPVAGGPSPSPPQTDHRPPPARHFSRPPPASAPPATSGSRPKLHIFMPDTRNPPPEPQLEDPEDENLPIKTDILTLEEQFPSLLWNH